MISDILWPKNPIYRQFIYLLHTKQTDFHDIMLYVVIFLGFS